MSGGSERRGLRSTACQYRLACSFLGERRVEAEFEGEHIRTPKDRRDDKGLCWVSIRERQFLVNAVTATGCLPAYLVVRFIFSAKGRGGAWLVHDRIT